MIVFISKQGDRHLVKVTHRGQTLTGYADDTEAAGELAQELVAKMLEPSPPEDEGGKA